jgi:hypothetical protein
MATVVQLTGTASLTAHGRRLQRAGMYGYGREFYRTAMKTGSLPVRYYLLGHALELFLKTFLLNRGFKMSVLRFKPYGHDLSRLLNESVSEGIAQHLAVSAELIQDLDKFSKLYAGKDFEYLPSFFLLISPELPDMRRIQRFAARLNEKAREFV